MSNAINSRFAEIFNAHQGMVLQVCTGFLQGNRALAHDLMQEVFIQTWMALPGFKGASSTKTWIYRITVNTCLTYLRRQKSKPQLQVQHLPEQLADAIADTSAYKDYNQLYQAIGKLESTDRLIIMMVLDELEYPEISAIMGITEGNLRVKIHRIKQRLKNLMQHG